MYSLIGSEDNNINRNVKYREMKCKCEFGMPNEIAWLHLQRRNRLAPVIANRVKRSV